MSGFLRIAVSVLFFLFLLPTSSVSGDRVSINTATLLKTIGTERGIVAMLDVPPGEIDTVIQLAKGSELRIYCQSPDAAQVAALRLAAEKAKLLGQQGFVQLGSSASIHLGSNIADCVLANPVAKNPATDAEMLRVLRPLATAHIGDRKLVKGDFQTQFLADPKFSPMPEQTVIAGERIYKAMGHIAHKANQNAMLNKLLCINAYNGTILWMRDLPKGFMIHRNTMIATADALYMGDHESCKVFDAMTGTLSEQVNSGVSMQGNLTIKDGELRFLAGGVYETARYDLETLKCLNTPKLQITSQFRTAFYPYYPQYGKYVSLEHQLADGSTLICDSSYEGSSFTNLSLFAPLPDGKALPSQEASRWTRRRGKKAKVIWRDKGDGRFTSFIVSGEQVMATGHADGKPELTFLVAINVKDGSKVWVHKTPAETVKGGTAIDAQGRIFTTLINGQLLCFEPVEP